MKNLNNSSQTSTPPEESKPLPKKKDDSSSDNYRLTPSEIESLRTHGKQISAQVRGRSKHLFQGQ